MKITAKITKVRRRDYTSIRCSVVHNFRDFAGRPRNKILASFPTFRSTDLGNEKKRAEYWSKVEIELLRLALNGGVMNQDLASIRKKIGSVIPRPAAVPAKASTERPIETPSAQRPIAKASSEIFAKYPFLQRKD